MNKLKSTIYILLLLLLSVIAIYVIAPAVSTYLSVRNNPAISYNYTEKKAIDSISIIPGYPFLSILTMQIIADYDYLIEGKSYKLDLYLPTDRLDISDAKVEDMLKKETADISSIAGILTCAGDYSSASLNYTEVAPGTLPTLDPSKVTHLETWTSTSTGNFHTKKVINPWWKPPSLRLLMAPPRGKEINKGTSTLMEKYPAADITLCTLVKEQEGTIEDALSKLFMPEVVSSIRNQTTATSDKLGFELKFEIEADDNSLRLVSKFKSQNDAYAVAKLLDDQFYREFKLETAVDSTIGSSSTIFLRRYTLADSSKLTISFSSKEGNSVKLLFNN